jgi:hypothetical protein
LSATNENTEALLVASTEIGLEVNAERTKYGPVHISRPECRTNSHEVGWSSSDVFELSQQLKIAFMKEFRVD